MSKFDWIYFDVVNISLSIEENLGNILRIFIPFLRISELAETENRLQLLEKEFAEINKINFKNLIKFAALADNVSLNFCRAINILPRCFTPEDEIYIIRLFCHAISKTLSDQRSKKFYQVDELENQRQVLNFLEARLNRLSASIPYKSSNQQELFNLSFLALTEMKIDLDNAREFGFNCLAKSIYEHFVAYEKNHLSWFGIAPEREASISTVFKYIKQQQCKNNFDISGLIGCLLLAKQQAQAHHNAKGHLRFFGTKSAFVNTIDHFLNQHAESGFFMDAATDTECYISCYKNSLT